MRKLGDITLDLEELLEEMIDEHELQKGEVLGLVQAWIDIHRPDAIEEYEDGTRPVFIYGHKDYVNKFKV